MTPTVTRTVKIAHISELVMDNGTPVVTRKSVLAADVPMMKKEGRAVVVESIEKVKVAINLADFVRYGRYLSNEEEHDDDQG